MTMQDVSGIPVKPTEFKAPAGNPFKYDLLDRRPAVESLTKIVRSARSPYVISVDAEWGAGKTAFLNMCSQHMQEHGFHVVHFNAWETDFAGSPFEALSAEITQSLEQHSEPTIKGMAESLKGSATEVILTLAKAAVRGAGTFLPFAGPVVAETTVKVIDLLRSDPISEYQLMKNSITKFKESIGKIAVQLSSHEQGKPLVIAIDELDRCRPSYAIELIEITKHIFLADNIVFILAVNSSELAHSVNSLYGAKFDAEGYLRRFFDLQFRLPKTDRAQFVDALIRTTGLKNLINAQPDEAALSLKLITSYLSNTRDSLREVEQATHRLGLILQLLDDVKPWMTSAAIIALILRETEPNVYLRYLHGESTDQEVIDALFTNLPIQTPYLASAKAEIEGAVIAVTQPWASTDTGMFAELTSPLILNHRKVQSTINPSNKHFTDEEGYSIDVMDYAGRVWRSLQYEDQRSKLEEAMQFLELVLPGYSPSTTTTVLKKGP